MPVRGANVFVARAAQASTENFSTFSIMPLTSLQTMGSKELPFAI
jgi:hypothetical protein